MQGLQTGSPVTAFRTRARACPRALEIETDRAHVRLLTLRHARRRLARRGPGVCGRLSAVTRPLEGIKVVDFAGHGFVPSAAAALADWGAEVVKIERPSGDPLRAVIRDGLVADADGTDYIWEFFNRNKRGIALDIETAAGREIFERLVKWADVYITNQLPRVRRKLRTEPADLFALEPAARVREGTRAGPAGTGRRSRWLRLGVVLVTRRRRSHAQLARRRATRRPARRPGRHPVRHVPRRGHLRRARAAWRAPARASSSTPRCSARRCGRSRPTWPTPRSPDTSRRGPGPTPRRRSPLVGQHQTSTAVGSSSACSTKTATGTPTCRALGLARA